MAVVGVFFSSLFIDLDGQSLLLSCLGNSFHIFGEGGHQAISGHSPRWPPKKLVGSITYKPFVWTAFKFGMVVHSVFLMIRLTFGINPLKTKWLPQSFKNN